MRTAPSHLAYPLSSLLLAVLAACGGGGGDSGGSSSSTSTTAQDVAAAKAMIGNLRNNALALQDKLTPATGVPDGVQKFGTEVQTQGMSLVAAAADSIRLDQMAFSLWDDYKNGRTGGVNFVNNASAFAGCTVYQGAFPGTALGPFNTPFVGNSVEASSAANATWVGCSKNSGPLATSGARRYRQTKLYNMAAAVTAGTFPGSVTYTAVTRTQFTDQATRVANVVNLTPVFSGTVGFPPPASGSTNGFVLRGDLPPLTDAAGALLADHYAADVSGSAAPHGSGGLQVTFARGAFTSVPVGAAASGTLKVDLSDAAAGVSSFVLPTDETSAAQLAAARATVYATISAPSGRMSGSLVAETFTRDSSGELVPGHVRFAGTVAVLPAGGSAPVSFLDGVLDYTRAGIDIVDFNGKLTLPARPDAALKVNVTESSATSQHIKGSYTQSGLTIDFEGDRTPSATKIVFSDSNGVKATMASNVATSDVTVGGRHAAVIRKDGNTVVYDDGTTETLQ